MTTKLQTKSPYHRLKSVVLTLSLENKFGEAYEEYATSGTTNQEINLHSCEYRKQKMAFLISAPSYELPSSKTSYSAAEILASKTFFDQRMPQRFDMKSIYENLMKDPLLKSILQTAALFDNPNFHIALLNDAYTNRYKKSIKQSSSVGHYNNSNTIVISAARPFPEMIGTLIHELTHYVMQKLYHNRTNPYRKNDKKAEQAFEEVIKDTLCNMLDEQYAFIQRYLMKDKTIQEIGQKLFSNPNALFHPVKTCFAIFGAANSYNPEDYHSEFIARLPQAIIENGHSPLLQPLMRFFEQFVVPDMKHLLATYPTNYRLETEKAKSPNSFVERLQYEGATKRYICSLPHF